ncbi:hypothetical protein J1N35_001244 [Gossypium stocksii]|uniref:Uncharacterized protein n=1 Tax=Gossypium stocksii TaxID=47602 RepID=A0A9D3WJ03_9ROSI|nr:hypothetical protein J1N35_001244 [Gossypium stocksii]
MENYFHAKGIVDDAFKVRQEVEQRGVQKLSEAMTVVEFVVMLGLGKDKLGSSKSEERGVREKHHKEDNVDGNGNGDNGVRKKLAGKALGLGSSARGVEAKEPKSEKKLVKCFLCHDLHKLRKCPRKSVIEGNDGVDKEPKKLGSGKGKAETERAKMSKKKQVKCFLCCGPHELWNYPKQAVVKGKTMFELGKSSEGLPPKEELNLSSNLEEEVVMKIVKLRPMRLKSSEASELAESSTRLPPMGEVGDVSNFKGKEVTHWGQLTRLNGTSRMTRVKKRQKPRRKSQRKGKAKASRRDRGKSSQCHSKVTMRML